MTILFHDDWKLYPDAIIDLETKNQSFLRLATLYRDMGIKNHAICLQLHNPALQGVDPYDSRLSVSDMEAIAIECKNNIFYFLREIARDPAGSDEYPIPFRINRGVMSLYFSFLNHILIILIMIRQTGKSFGIDWLYTYLLNIRLTKSEISHLTKDEKLRGRELERLKSMELTLPHYLKQRGARDPGNTEVLKISSLDNYFKAYLPNKSAKLADIIGRGMTSQIVGVDEFGYIFNNMITIPVMLSATLAAREIARIKNEPYGTIFATTSAKRDTPEGKYAYKMMNDAAIWSDHFYDAENHEQLMEMVKKASPQGNHHINSTWNHRQLGYTDEWLRARLKEAVQEDPTAIAADFFNEWPSGSNTSPLSQEDAKTIRESEVLDPYNQIAPPEGYVLRWYYKAEEIGHRLSHQHHILSIDSSEMVGNDAVGATLRNIETAEIAMAADISEGNLILFCRWLALFLKENTNVTLIIERRSTGAMILDYLLIYLPELGIDPFTRIYNQVVQYHEEFPDRYQSIQGNYNPRLLVEYKKFFGWATSGSGATSRGDLYGRTFNNSVRMSATSVRDRKLVLQILGLEIRNGRIDHPEGEKDDLVISWLLSYWLMTQGKNLRHYGIDSSKILSENKHYLQNLKDVSRFQQHVNLEARAAVERLTKELKETKDPYLAIKIEQELELALTKLSDQDRKVISADDLINRLREERTKNARAIQNTLSQVYGGLSAGYSGYNGYSGYSGYR